MCWESIMAGIILSGSSLSTDGSWMENFLKLFHSKIFLASNWLSNNCVWGGKPQKGLSLKVTEICLKYLKQWFLKWKTKIKKQEETTVAKIGKQFSNLVSFPTIPEKKEIGKKIPETLQQ